MKEMGYPPLSINTWFEGTVTESDHLQEIEVSYYFVSPNLRF